jgi:hypothetical protein
MSISRMVAAAVLGISLAQLLPSECLAAGTLAKVAVATAKAIEPRESGGTTVEIEAVLTVKNESDGVIGVSPRQFEYSLVPKGADGKEGEPHMFFGIKDPDLRDANPLAPGESIELSASLEGHTIGVDKAAKYLLVVRDPGNERTTKRIEMSFK